MMHLIRVIENTMTFLGTHNYTILLEMFSVYSCVTFGIKTKKQQHKNNIEIKLQRIIAQITAQSTDDRKKKIRNEYIHWGKSHITKIDFCMHLRFCFD